MTTLSDLSASSRKRLVAARVALAEALVDPLAEIQCDQSSAVVRADQVWTIPSDLAAYGFDVSMCQRKSGWEVAIERELLGGLLVLHAIGVGASLLEALSLLADDAATKLNGFIEEALNAGEVVSA